MSGGSYNYLCDKNVADTFGNQGDLEEMVERLTDLYPTHDATAAARDLLCSMRAQWKFWRRELDSLHVVFHAIEWLDSCDYSKDAADKEMAKYVS